MEKFNFKNIPDCPGKEDAPETLRQLFSVLKDGETLEDGEVVFEEKWKDGGDGGYQFSLVLECQGETSVASVEIRVRQNEIVFSEISGETISGHVYGFSWREGEDSWTLEKGDFLKSWRFWPAWLSAMGPVRVEKEEIKDEIFLSLLRQKFTGDTRVYSTGWYSPTTVKKIKSVIGA